MYVNSYCWAICEFAVMSHMWSQKHDIAVTSLWCFYYDLTCVTCLWYHCDIVVISLLDWVADSSSCSTNHISKYYHQFWQLYQNDLPKYCDIVYLLSGINQVWILKNSKQQAPGENIWYAQNLCQTFGSGSITLEMLIYVHVENVNTSDKWLVHLMC